jgi:hypothetical protein
LKDLLQKEIEFFSWLMFLNFKYQFKSFYFLKVYKEQL